MTDSSKSKGKGVKSTLGVLGAIATIISVWWFALRPAKKSHQEDEE
jgi:cbb3-type cytochrome oxidase subunit 3